MAIKKDLDNLRDEVADIRDTGHKTHRVVAAILKTTESIDGRLKSMQDHGQRLKRLEDELFAGTNRSGFQS